MKPDELSLLRELQRRSHTDESATPDDVASALGMHPKRLLLLCQGWWARRWLDLSDDHASGARFVKGRLNGRGMQAGASEL